MSKKRTKEQKMKARYHYSTTTHRHATTLNEAQPIPTVTVAQQKSTDVLSLYHYDPIWIVRDIRWTMLSAIIILAIQLGLYFWWH